MKQTLYNYWRSSASYRVRIALGLKGVAYEYVAVDITNRRQHADAYTAKNPLAQVPTLEVTDDQGGVHNLTQSLAILEYLDERYPNPPLLPKDVFLRAHARALAEMINAGIQPFHNLSTIAQIKAMGGDDVAWVRGFIDRGMAAFARAAAIHAGVFCVGDSPSIADCCLIPQLATARRLGSDVSAYQALVEIEQRCLALAAFADAAPDRQPDAAPH